MRRVVALLTHKEQPMVGPVGAVRPPTPRTRLTGVVGVQFDAQAPSQGGLVGEQALEFSEGPFAGMPIRFPCPLGHGNQLFALAAVRTALGSLSDASELFQPDAGVGMGRQDAFADRVIGIQL
jgi:hypothetical protein